MINEAVHEMTTVPEKLTLGFLGVGWIGKNRLESLLQNNCIQKAIISDISQKNIDTVLSYNNSIDIASTFDDLLSSEIDGIVIATPNALHASQSITALEHGFPVFCQKPLGRNISEVNAILQTARQYNKLLGVDMSYRYCEAITALRNHVNSIGNIFAVDAHFHNAYGPDKQWFFDYELSGGGCVLDLGIHIIDLILWLMNFPAIEHISSQLFASGKRITNRTKQQVEDYATFTLKLENECVVNCSCSWNLPIGENVSISITLYGTKGGLSFFNLNGSYYDFCSEIFNKTQKITLSLPPDKWGGRAIFDWSKKLAINNTFDDSIIHTQITSSVIDHIYSCC